MKECLFGETSYTNFFFFFFCSLVVLAVPNGPVYELVVKGSAVPKEEDK